MSNSPSHTAFLAPDPAQLAPLFPGYQIECLIATGGMGAVYRAIQKSLDRTVAIKILPREFSADAAFCDGFEAEAKAMARLNHPNLIGVYDFGEVDGMLYIVMEYVPGESLFHAANGRAIAPNEVIRLVSGICDGLTHAHDNGILHRDIKPSNILLDLNAQPKIGDFGLARPVDRQIQEGEQIFGTPHYTAPEVVDAPHSVDNRADIFSIGVILHELLTGRLPADDRRSASAIIHCDPRFDAIISRATNPSPAARYASAAEITKALHAVASSAGPKAQRAAGPATRAPQTPRQVRRGAPAPKKSSSPQGIFVLLAILAVGGGAYYFLSKPKTSPTAAKPGTQASTSTPQPKPEVAPPPVPDILRQPEQPGTAPVIPSVASPAPEPSTPAASAADNPPAGAEPSFDVQDFLEKRARPAMKERVASRIATRDQDLAKNLAEYDKTVRRYFKTSLDKRKPKVLKQAEAALDDLLSDSRKNRNLLPAELPDDWEDYKGTDDDLEKFHSKYFTKQQSIDEVLGQSLAQQAPTYILGITKQIERLQGGKDPAAVKLLEEEIARVRSDSSYFPNLMLGIDPDDEDGSAPP